MRLSFSFVTTLATAAIFAAVTTAPAQAECKRYGFSVNDYGKDGPTKDAKSLLDKLIATKMSEKGIKDYKTGKKSVRCELFLNFIVFDEYTCTAEATACWGKSSLPKSEEASAEDEGEDETKSAAAETSKDEKNEAAAEKKEAVGVSSAAEKAIKATKTAEKPADDSTKKAEAPSKEAVIAKEVAEKQIPDPKDSHSAVATAKADDPASETKAAKTEEAKHEDATAADASSEAKPATETATASPSDNASKTPSSVTVPPAESKKPAAVAKKSEEPKPVETGSLGKPAKKPAEKGAEKSEKPASKTVRRLAPGPGYPVPMPPPDDLGP